MEEALAVLYALVALVAPSVALMVIWTVVDRRAAARRRAAEAIAAQAADAAPSAGATAA